MGADFFGFLGRFEVYSITIHQLIGKQSDLRSIHVDGSHYQLLYERGDDNKVPLDEPLPLIGPKYASAGRETQLDILFGKTEDHWWFEVSLEEEGPQVKTIRDPLSGSTATICYEVIQYGVDARLEFNYEDLEGRDIKIVEGEISATTNGNIETKRVLQSFDSKNNTAGFDPKDSIPLLRPRLGVPLNSKIDVTVSLTCQFVPSLTMRKRKRTEGNFKIFRTHTISVPKSEQEEDWYFSPETSSSNVDMGCLHLKVTWLDEAILDMRRFTSRSTTYWEKYPPISPSTLDYLDEIHTSIFGEEEEPKSAF